MIRKADSGDLETIMSLIRANSDTFAESEIPAARRDIKALLGKRGRDGGFYVSPVRGKIAGCAGFSRHDDTNGVYSLNWLAVNPGFKRRGVATELYDFIEARIKAMNARLIMLNAGSGEENRYFYRKIGFKRAGSIPRYYGDSKDLVWYYKLL